MILCRTVTRSPDIMTPEASPEITSATLSPSSAVCASRNPHLLPHQDAVDSDDDFRKQDKISHIAPAAVTTNVVRAPALNIPTDALGSVSAEDYVNLPYLPLASPAASPRRRHNHNSSGSGRSSGDTMSSGYLLGNGGGQGTGSGAAPLSHSDLDLPAVYALVSDLHARALVQHESHTHDHLRLTRRLDALVLAVDWQLHQQRHHTPPSAGVYTYDPRLDAVLEEMQDARNQLLAILGRLEAHDAYRERHYHLEHDYERLAYDHDALVALHESLKMDYAELHHAYDALKGRQRGPRRKTSSAAAPATASPLDRHSHTRRDKHEAVGGGGGGVAAMEAATANGDTAGAQNGRRAPPKRSWWTRLWRK